MPRDDETKRTHSRMRVEPVNAASLAITVFVNASHGMLMISACLWTRGECELLYYWTYWYFERHYCADRHSLPGQAVVTSRDWMTQCISSAMMIIRLAKLNVTWLSLLISVFLEGKRKKKYRKTQKTNRGKKLNNLEHCKQMTDEFLKSTKGEKN